MKQINDFERYIFFLHQTQVYFLKGNNTTSQCFPSMKLIKVTHPLQKRKHILKSSKSKLVTDIKL